MEQKKSIAPTVVIILVFLLAFGGMWVSMPMKFVLSMHTGTPNDSVFTIIDPDKMNIPENQLHFRWAIAEIKGRIAVLGSIIFIYLCTVYFYVRYRDAANKRIISK